MGKRGPAPKGDYPDKSTVLSTRIRRDTRDALARAAKARGRSLSQEIENRLRRSFESEAKLVDMFGGSTNYRLVQMIAIAMSLRSEDGPQADWLQSPELFLEVLHTIHHVLWQIRPRGTDEYLWIAPRRSEEVAEALWAMIHSADSTMPLGVSSQQYRANAIKADLGDLVERPTYSLTDYIPPAPSAASKSPRSTTRRKKNAR
jgi:hypothetical protein